MMTMRIGCVALAIAMGLVATAQDLQKKVTFTSTAATVGKALEALTKEAGVRLQGGTRVKDDVLVLRLKEVTVLDAMKKIAEAVGGDWQPLEGGYVLTRGGEDDLRDQREDNRIRTAQIEKAVKALSDEVAKTPIYDEAVARRLKSDTEKVMQEAGRGGARGFSFGQMTSRQPGGRAITKLIAAMKPSDLAALKPNTRTVFSTAPTAMQRPMPNGANAIVKGFVEEQKVLEQIGGGDSTVFGGGGAVMVVDEQFEGERPAKPTGPPAKALLVASRPFNNNDIQFQLLVANAQGQFLARGFSILSVEDPTPATTEIKTEEPIKLSDLGTKLAAILASTRFGAQGMMIASFSVATGDEGTADIVTIGTPAASASEPKAPDLTADLRQRILNPELYDPLALIPGDLLVATAEARNQNLVALLTDGSLMPAARKVKAAPMTPSQVIQAARNEWRLNVTEADGWMTITPTLPWRTRETRVSRTGLGKFLRTVDTKGFANLDEIAAFLLAGDSGDISNGIDSVFTRLVNSGFADSQLGNLLFGQREMIQFYGLLGSSQRQTLLAGRPIQIGGLNGKQRDLLHSMVFNSMEGPRIQLPGQGGGRQGPRGILPMMGDSLATERTEALAGGIPNVGFFTLASELNLAVYATNSSGGRFLTADEMARDKAMSDGTIVVSGISAPKYDKFKPASRTTYRFNFQLSRNASMSRQLEDNIPPAKNEQAVSYDQLPAEFRREVEQRAERLRRMFQNTRVPGGRGGRPPY